MILYAIKINNKTKDYGWAKSGSYTYYGKKCKNTGFLNEAQTYKTLKGAQDKLTIMQKDYYNVGSQAEIYKLTYKNVKVEKIETERKSDESSKY